MIILVHTIINVPEELKIREHRWRYTEAVLSECQYESREVYYLGWYTAGLKGQALPFKKS
jgi:hypothetical protein